MLRACRLRNACLVLAGPDPRAIADDPEGLEVLQELKNYFDTLPKEVQRDIKIVEVRAIMCSFAVLEVGARLWAHWYWLRCIPADTSFCVTHSFQNLSLSPSFFFAAAHGR